MNRWTVFTVSTLLGLIACTGCSGSGGDPISTPSNHSGIQQDKIQNDNGMIPKTNLLGYYDIYFDIETGEFEVNLNRSASFTLNLVPFLNKMEIPKNGITFGSIVIHDEDPNVLGVDVDFTVHHPFPGYAQYKGYDLLGVLIGDGSDTLSYNNLDIPRRGTNIWMKNPDGYTRWFNPTDFTSELIFGWAPGGWQNYKGSSQVNPYKYFAMNLQKDQNAWNFLTGDHNFDGIFQSGTGRTMKIEFPIPEPGISFGYAVVVAWEEQGESGPYHPYHHTEALVASFSQTPNAWFEPTMGDFGGDLILDIDLFAWEHQPSMLILESNVLNGNASFDFETHASPGGEHYSTWHIEVAVDQIQSLTGNETWIIAEYSEFDYKNGLVGVPSPNDPLAAFFRYDLEIVEGEPVPDPLVCDVVVDPVSPDMPYEGWETDFTFDASGSWDPNGAGITSYEWDFDNDGNFGDTFDAGDVIHPVKHFDFINQDKVSLRISNDELFSECFVDVDITAYPTKNIVLRDGVDAVDIGIDHTNGNLFMSYSDATTYIYARSDFYQVGTYFTTIVTVNPNPTYIDVVPNQYHMVGMRFSVSNAPGMALFYPDGVQKHIISVNPTWSSMDVMAMGSNGAYANNICMVSGYDNPFTDFPTVRIFNDNFPYDPGGYWDHDAIISDGIFTGIDRLYYPYVKACESDRDGDYVWFLEDPDYYWSRWEMSNIDFVGYLDFDTAYFGTGSQTNNDDGWNDARDLTRDNQNRYFVLDKLSTGEPRVKVWTVSGDTTTSIGGIGDSTSISGEPLRIEGGDYEGIVIVLHGSNSPQMISVFLPDEMPG